MLARLLLLEEEGVTDGEASGESVQRKKFSSVFLSVTAE